MAIAAVPDYLGKDFGSASPGMRFGMYLALWGEDQRTKQKHWTTQDTMYEVRGRDQRERAVPRENKVNALKQAARLTPGDQAAMRALLERQQHAFAVLEQGGYGAVFDARAVAPFATGLGNAHPLENGFAFLDPYGLPYLPGSGVKGVLRQAARELATGTWGENPGWDVQTITALFGMEEPGRYGEALRGALVFWDVIPQVAGDHLAVEIMTPHQKHYYQDGQSPHESGSPVPLTFLTVPPGSGFVFHVQCNRTLLSTTAPELLADDQWKILLQAAFEHAFAWLGFGAKTAVGYGAMAEDQTRKAARDEQLRQKQEEERLAAEQMQREQEIASMGPVDRAIAECLDARVDPNQPEINALVAALRANTWPDDIAAGVAEYLKEKMSDADRWRETSARKNPQKDRDHQNTLLVMGFLKRS